MLILGMKIHYIVVFRFLQKHAKYPFVVLTNAHTHTHTCTRKYKQAYIHDIYTYLEVQNVVGAEIDDSGNFL